MDFMQKEENSEKFLADLTREGELYERLSDGKVQCFACGHLCKITDGQTGLCRIRFNREGKLFVPWGYVGALQCDPIEKKPFFHVLPGQNALSFGMLGCNFHCDFCQNWISSQTLRDLDSIIQTQAMDPKTIVTLAQQYRAPVLVSTYNEPLITSEWAVSIFKEAREAQLRTAYVSNGHASEQVIDYLKPWLEFFKVDLKCFNDDHYRKLGGQLKTVLKTIERLKEKAFWVEIVTLCIPQFNDSEKELRDIAQFIASVSPDIPWHITAFHPNYRMQDRKSTPTESLIRAADIGKEAGLHFVYTGNLPGKTRNLENTLCPQCGRLLIERYGFTVRKNNLQNGQCPSCQKIIPGIWN